MRKIDFEPTFKKEMSNIEIEGIESIAKRLNYDDCGVIGNDWQFAYTSSGDHAMHNNMGEMRIEDLDSDNILDIGYFAITENDMLIMVCEDMDENRIYIEVEPNDFY